MDSGERARGEGKASDALLDMARPWLETAGAEVSREQRRALLRCLSLAWNAVVLDRGPQPGAVALLRQVLHAPGAPNELLPVFDAFIARKREERVRDDRVIVGVELRDDAVLGECLRVEWADAADHQFHETLAVIEELARAADPFAVARSLSSSQPAAAAGDRASAHEGDPSKSKADAGPTDPAGAAPTDAAGRSTTGTSTAGAPKAGDPTESSAPTNAAGNSAAGERLAAFLRPVLRATAGDVDTADRRRMLNFGALVWNTVLQEQLYRPAVVAPLRQRVEQGGDSSLLSIFDELVAHKRSASTMDLGVLVSATARAKRGTLVLSFETCAAPSLDDAVARKWFESVLKKQLRIGLPARRAAKSRESAARQGAGVPSPWRRIHELAAELFALAPWRWMDDSELFGVRLPGERLVQWVCVMGAAGQMSGLAAYDGDAGFEAHRRAQADEVETPEAAYGSDGWLVTYVPSDELSERERERAQASGVRFGGGAWPRFERTLSGKLPQSIEEHHVAQLTFLLERAIEATGQRAREPELLQPQSGGARRVWTVADGRSRVELVAPGPAPRPDFAPVDRGAVSRLQRSTRRGAEALEFDVQPWFARIADEQGGEFVPAAVMLIEARTGRPLGVELLPPEKRYSRAAAELAAILQRSGVLPREVRVRRAWLREAIKPWLDALGVRTSFADELPMLAAFSRSMQESIARGELRP